MRKMFLFMFLMTLFALKVNAEACDAYDIKRLKEIANGVEITYEQLEPFGNNDFIIYDNYKLKIVGLTEEIYLFDKLNDKLIYYSDTNNGHIEYTSVYNGTNYFYIYSKDCSYKLSVKKINLPVYNYYHNYKECKDINHAILYCDEYVDEYFEKEQFLNAYNGYINNNNYGISNYKKYIPFIIGGAFFLIIVFVFIFLRKRKENLL